MHLQIRDLRARDLARKIAAHADLLYDERNDCGYIGAGRCFLPRTRGCGFRTDHP